MKIISFALASFAIVGQTGPFVDATTQFNPSGPRSEVGHNFMNGFKSDVSNLTSNENNEHCSVTAVNPIELPYPSVESAECYQNDIDGSLICTNIMNDNDVDCEATQGEGIAALQDLAVQCLIVVPDPSNENDGGVVLDVAASTTKQQEEVIIVNITDPSSSNVAVKTMNVTYEIAYKCLTIGGNEQNDGVCSELFQDAGLQPTSLVVDYPATWEGIVAKYFETTLEEMFDQTTSDDDGNMTIFSASCNVVGGTSDLYTFGASTESSGATSGLSTTGLFVAAFIAMAGATLA